jgi:F-type H+-transporting ATPase subunit a
MEEIGHRLVCNYFPFTNIPIPMGGVNVLTIGNTLLAMLVIWVLLWVGVRRFAMLPGRAQLLVETVVGGFDKLVRDTLNLETKEANRHYVPLIVSLFIFLFFCNALPLIPLPNIEEPTSDLNLTLSLGLMSVLYSLYCGVRAHGVFGLLSEMCGPLFSMEGPRGVRIAGKLSAIFFFPLHVVELFSKIVSISFRLFGNITGAAVVMVVVCTLTYYFMVPLALYGFLLVFESAIQAFVFAMLTLMYISAQMRHE